MPEKLELKHLAPYLPYGLKVEFDYETLIGELKSLCSFRNTCSLMFRTLWDDIHFDEIKPIHRPLSDLTKEIENNGERFVPIAELLKLKYPYERNYDSKYGLITIDGEGYPKAFYTYRANFDIMINPYNIRELHYWIVEKLLSWHFDLYGLIESGLAIDINTLNKKL